MLLNFWSEISQRKAKEINLLNHTGSILIAIDQADKAESTKLDAPRWLPFDLGDSNRLSISPEIAQLLVRLRNAGELPPMMIRDLYKHKLINPGD